jgi:hypothetical protein
LQIDEPQHWPLEVQVAPTGLPQSLPPLQTTFGARQTHEQSPYTSIAPSPP